jgi:hypothetical protein
VTDTAVALSKSQELPLSSGQRRPMTSKPAKSALATFRLSQEEYEESKRACTGLGYRSFSELARMAVLSRLRSNQSRETAQTDARLDHIEQAADEVCRLLRQICAMISALEAKKS